jgi:hypothetical protein
MYSGTNHGFLLRDQTEGSAGFKQGYSTRESSYAAELVVTFG